ncbi:MAG TPA: CAP domain-containing protein [Gemmatimonadaceae bacterium]|jgi:uncharacterized protein YkwD|nr:CAP domain-containing protein [Gemmatimonadaceae bacterium]
MGVLLLMRVPPFFAAPAVAFLVAGCVIPVPAPAPSPPPPTAASARPSAYSGTEARIFSLINAQRQHQGLPPLYYSAQLDRMAKIQATNMARLHKMAHTLPESELPTLGDRAQFVGYPFGRMSENVAQGYPNAETVVQGWMNSSAHRHNVLDRDVVETGIGIAKAPGGGLYFCQVFARRIDSI